MADAPPLVSIGPEITRVDGHGQQASSRVIAKLVVHDLWKVLGLDRRGLLTVAVRE
jgi:hypothetical protein